jgi:flagellin
MALTVNTNISALNAYRNLTSTQGDMSKSLQRLSSGLRINSAADDAAGLVISEGLRGQVGGLKVAARNAQDGISVVQTAEGALNQVHSILQRMRDLSVQAANTGGLNDEALTSIKNEMDQLGTELTRIGNTTEFNGTKLLNGSYDGTFQVGANSGANDKITVALNTGVTAAGLGLDELDVSATSSPATFTGVSIAVGSATAPATPTIAYGGTTYTLDLTGWKDGTDADDGDANTADNVALVQAQLTSKLSGSGLTATVDETGALSITAPGSATEDSITFGAAFDTDDIEFTAGTAGGADAAIDAIDAAITSVSTTRATLGAIQNRFEYAIDNINVATENLSASESRIRDTDMALEMSNYTRAQILQQAGTAMLAQANQAPQGVLQLLQG